ncbi:MAG: glycosyltransferase, partial [Planctomycetales bacterium]|nr:glycosyltransferase [Planctomycetales bacterium]
MSSIQFVVVALCALLCIVLVPACLVLCIECFAAAFLRRDVVAEGDGESPERAAHAVVLIPAHNEELSIGGTLASILPQLAATQRVLVVADNCTDETAAIARALGADVVERHNV